MSSHGGLDPKCVAGPDEESPNGFDLDSIGLHMEMKENGLLRRTAA